MPRGYRLLVIALGLALACANHAHAKGGGEQPQTRQPVETSLEHIAGRYDELAERAKSTDQQEAPCGSNQYGSNADLCAQWKAADAASDSAWWAWLGGLISVGSLVGVFAALGLAFNSNSIAQDTAKRQLRAYMGILDCEISGVEETGAFVLTARLQNAGQTPAYKVRLAGESFAAEYPLKDERDFLPISEGYDAPVNPGHDICCAKRISTTSFDQTMQYVLTGELGLYIQGICTYEDAFGQSQETKFRYVFAGQPASIGMLMHSAKTGNSAT